MDLFTNRLELSAETRDRISPFTIVLRSGGQRRPAGHREDCQPPRQQPKSRGSSEGDPRPSPEVALRVRGVVVTTGQARGDQVSPGSILGRAELETPVLEAQGSANEEALHGPQGPNTRVLTITPQKISKWELGENSYITAQFMREDRNLVVQPCCAVEQSLWCFPEHLAARESRVKGKGGSDWGMMAQDKKTQTTQWFPVK